MLNKTGIALGVFVAISTITGTLVNSIQSTHRPAEVARAKTTQPVLQILIPLYIYPEIVNGRNTWQPLADAARQVPVLAIVNPNSGPGGKPNADYLQGMKLIQQAGAKMIGYVSTDYGKRPWAKVQADIDLYDKYFSVSGIFLDETASDPKLLSHYAQIYKYIKSKPKLQQVVANPGTHIDERYLSQPAADQAVIFESFGKDWLQYQPSGYLRKYDRRRFALMLHNVPDQKTMQQYLDLAVQRNIGYIYITNDTESPNPWDSFPNYWSAEIESIRAKNLATP
jgi:Spherulation-specific family 4